MKAYKGFNKNLQCTPINKKFQYEIGKEYEEKDADLCCSGFHACENPLDTFSYYPPSDSRYCKVELDDISEERGNDSKICGRKIKICAEVGIKGIIDAGIKFIFEKVDWNNSKESNTGDYSASTNTGDRSASTNTGYRSASTNTGDCSASTNTGDYSASKVTGEGSVAISCGYDSKASGAIGCAIVVCERREWNGNSYPLLNIKSAIVDGKTIKADTFYKVVNNEWVECED